MHVYSARAADTSVSTGLGSFSVSGVAPAGMRTFADIMVLGDTIYLGRAHRDLVEWEEGIYTYVGTNRLARTLILESSNSGAPVDFSAGIQDVWSTIPSRSVQRIDENITQAGQAIIDFGASPATQTSLVVSAPGITSTAMVMVQLMVTATDDHTTQDHWTNAPVVTAGEIVAGESFTIRATERLPVSGGLHGKYSVCWLWKA